MNEPPNPEVAVFAAALELPPDQRGAYLDQACAGDAALRRQVEALLQVHDDAGNFFDKLSSVARPASAEGAMAGSSGTHRIPRIPAEKAGDRIGRYKLLQQIGEGGCGVVYMAEQEEPVRRRVALKVIKLGMDTKSVIARFEAERQALALMDHPNIAKVLEAGATETGRPYFVMELVRGVKITDYCDQNNLSTQERLDLFIQICRAIQHAHQKGIIHRDIKPSNILVTVNDGMAVPKVIDFGIAKATQGRLTDHTLFTAFEQFIGTPAYMSPEQAEMTSLDIDTRSDIYSLGVLLYELLTSQTPFDAKELLQAGLDEIRRTIREQEPARPSTRLSTMLGADLTMIAKHRRAEPPGLIHLVRGDLDWIVMKALEKDRTRRYETANGLAMDIQRHLENEPILARPPSSAYSIQKLIRRNKLAFTAASAVTTALIIGLGVSTWMFFKEQQSRQQAQEEAAKATAISDFFQQSLQAANPDESKSSDYTVRQLLDDYSTGLEGRFTNQPAVEAAVRATIGKAYYRLGAGDKAQPHLERALVLNRQLYGEHEQAAATLADCAWASFEQKEYTQAELQARAALEIYRKDGMVGQPVLFALWALQQSLNLQNRIPDSIVVGEQALDMARKTPGIEHPETASILHGLAESKIRQSKFAEAETLARQAVEMHRRLQGSRHPETAWALVALGQALGGQNKLDEAERADREALNIFRRQFLSGNKSVDSATFFLKAVLEAKGDWPGLAAIDQTTLADQRSILGGNSPAVATTLSSLASHLQLGGKQAEAEKALREAMDITPRAMGSDSVDLPALLRQESKTLEVLQKAPEAEKLYEEAINAGRLSLGKTNLILGELLHDYAEFLNHEGKMAAAAENYLQSLPIRRAQQNENLAWTLRDLGGVLNQLGRYKEAEGYLQESLALSRKLHPQGDMYGTGWAGATLGDALWQEHKLPDAEQAYRDALSVYTKVGAVGATEYDDAAGSLLNVLKDEKKLAESEALCHEILAQQRAVFTNDNAAIAATLIRLVGILQDESNPSASEQAYRQALAIEEKLPGEEHSFVASSLALANLLRRNGRPVEAGVAAREAAQKCHASMAQYEKLASDSNHHHDSWGFAISYEAIGEVLNQTGHAQEAEKACLDAQVLWRKLVANFDSEDYRFHLAVNYDALGDVQIEVGRAAESLASYQAAQAIWAKLAADFNVEDHRVHLGWTDENIGQLLKESGRFDEATEAYRQALAVWKKLVADFNKDDYREGLSETVVGLAATLQTAGKRTEAEEFMREASEHADAQTLNGLAWLLATGPDPKFRDGTNAAAFAEKAAAATNRKNVSYLDTLAAAYAETGQFTKAISIQQEAIALSQSDDEKKGLASRLKLYESNSPYRDDGELAQLTMVRLSEGKFAEAEPPARECLRLREMQIPDHWRTFNAKSMLGGSLLGQKKYAEAEPLLISGYEGMKQREVSIPPEGKMYLNEALQRLAQYYDARQRPEEASEWRKKLAESEQDKK